MTAVFAICHILSAWSFWIIPILDHDWVAIRHTKPDIAIMILDLKLCISRWVWYPSQYFPTMAPLVRICFEIEHPRSRQVKPNIRLLLCQYKRIKTIFASEISFQDNFRQVQGSSALSGCCYLKADTPSSLEGAKSCCEISDASNRAAP